jgi:hypothetical protein
MTNASLLIVPDRFKASKLYSQLPQDGSGDFVVTRATTAFRTNENGILESVASGVPRLDFPIGSGCPALLVEPAATNLALRSEEFDDAYWTKSGALTISANSTISPTGVQNADTLTDASNAFLDVRRLFTIAANATHTYSLFVKKTTGSLTHFAGFAVLLTGVATRVDYGIINTTTGAINRDASSTINAVSYRSENYGDYWRVIVTFTDNQSNTGCTIIFYPAISSNGTSIDQNAQGSNVFWGAQLETGSVATSYIPTVAAAATRNADVINKTAVSGLIGQTEGTVYAEFNVSAIGAEGYVIRVGTASFNNTIYIFRSVTNTVGVAVRSNGASTFLPTAFNAGLGVVKVAIAYANADFAFYVNGVQRATGAAALSFTESLAAINLGAFASNTAVINDRIRAAALYTTRLSNAQLQSLTTL